MPSTSFVTGRKVYPIVTIRGAALTTPAALKAAFILDEFEDMSPEELRRRARELARNERRLAQVRFFALDPRLECPFKDHRLTTPQNIKPEPEIRVERGIKRERDHHDEGEPIDLTDDAPVAKRQIVPIELTDK